MKIYSNKPNLVNVKILEEALKITKNNVKNVAVGIEFVPWYKIKSLNKKIRNINKVTDVLSFPMLSGKTSVTLLIFLIFLFNDFISQCDDERDPYSRELYLGDIVICNHRAKKQAKTFGHSIEREICFLTLHGLLHLLGFDHIEKNDEVEMMEIAEKILKKFGITRGE